MCSKLILTWRNPKTRKWTSVGRLSYENNQYTFRYTQGAEVDGFTPFGSMTKLENSYKSEDLFPLFENRLLSKSRPEYGTYLSWLDIDTENNNKLLELSRTRGIRATDELQLFPIPEENREGKYEMLFFSHGISHMSECYHDGLSKLSQGDTLCLMKDVQNENDKTALLMRADTDPVEIMGYCPAFLTKDFNYLLDTNENVNVIVHQMNYHAPLQFKLLCKITTTFPKDFIPFNQKECLPIRRE